MKGAKSNSAAENVFLKKSPISRRGKPISEIFYRLPAARSRFPTLFTAFPSHKIVFQRIFPISRRGKAFFGEFSSFPASFWRFQKVLIGFAPREGVFGSPRSVSRFILAFCEIGDRLRISGNGITKSQASSTRTS